MPLVASIWITCNPPEAICGVTCGPPNGQPVPVVMSTPRPSRFASRVVWPSIASQPGDRNFIERSTALPSHHQRVLREIIRAGGKRHATEKKAGKPPPWKCWVIVRGGRVCHETSLFARRADARDFRLPGWVTADAVDFPLQGESAKLHIPLLGFCRTHGFAWES